MTLALAEDWLVAVLKDLLPADVAVMTGPHDWDGSFLKALIKSLPAVVIVFDGAEQGDGTSLQLNATWTIYTIVGWDGADEATRRRKADTGAYAIWTAIAVHLHNTNMGERQYTAAGTGGAVPNIPPFADLDGFGRLRVEQLLNEGSGEWSDRVGMAIYSLELSHDIPLEHPGSDGFDDWLRSFYTIDIPGGEPAPDIEDVGVEGDVPGQIDHRR